jgi:CRP/FNR family transcriptional regulator, cyclic AMP receptor protein
MAQVAVRPVSRATCRLLAEDADLAEAVPPELREHALDELLVTELHVEAGPFDPIDQLPAPCLGLLMLDGQMLRRAELHGRFGIELLGECDVLRPWQADWVTTLPVRSQWTVLAPARLAVLDVDFIRHLATYPALADRLFERAIRRSRHLVVNMAIVHQARVDQRLYLLFWHLASRWGRVRGDGVLVPVRITHAVLADLVAAQRPTVTSALTELSRRALVRSTDEGWLLSGAPPSESRPPV